MKNGWQAKKYALAVRFFFFMETISHVVMTFLFAIQAITLFGWMAWLMNHVLTPQEKDTPIERGAYSLSATVTLCLFFAELAWALK